MKIESGLTKFLQKRYGGWESIEVSYNDREVAQLEINFGDDEIVDLVIEKRNGNYQIVCES